MKNCFLVIIISFLGLLSCSRESKPDVLSVPQMSSILTDLHIADNIVSSQGLTYDSSRIVFHSKYKPFVLKKHNCDPAHFDKSFEYYQSHLIEMEEIYLIVVDSIASRQKTKNIQL